MISQTADYALRAVIYLAEVGEAQTIQQIANVTKVPAGYLSKVMQQLVRAGIVGSQRGLGGGFHLKIPAVDLSVYTVITAVDPLPRITSCPLSLEAHREHLCEMHRKLDEAMAYVEKQFRETTIAQVLNRPIFADEIARLRMLAR